MSWISDPQIWIALVTLTTLEIVLGIDNILVISILSNKLPKHEQSKARSTGLSLALITRILLLLSISWLTTLKEPLFTINFLQPHPVGISIRDLILIAGGVFLIYKATHEIHDSLECHEENIAIKIKETLSSVVFQIIVLDIVFSLDSVITAVGMAQQLGVMIAAVVIAVVIMLFASGGISRFIHDNPTLKILALSFLLMVGITLVAEGLQFHIPKGYIYFAMAFSGFVEALNIAMIKRKRTIMASDEVEPAAE